MITLAPSAHVLALVVRALLDSVWLGTPSVLLMYLIFRLFPKVGAGTRYAVSCALLGTMLALPLATVTGSLLRATFSPSPPYELQRSARTPGAFEERHSAARKTSSLTGSLASLVSPDFFAGPLSAAALAPAAERIQASGIRLAVYFFLIWAAITLLRLARLARAFSRLQSIKRHALPLEYDLPLPRNARLLSSDAIAVPSALGYLHPAIVFPVRFGRELTERSMRDILTHESAHLQRGDDWSALLYQISSCILWFNPAVYVLGRRMSVDREIACDDVVVARTAQPRSYARTLWTIAQRTLEPGQGLISGVLSHRSHLSLRLQRLLTVRPKEQPSASRLAISATAVLAGGALLAAGYLAPASAWPGHSDATIVPVASMADVRADHTATLLSDGKILIAGGLTGNTPDSALDTAELYDPATRTFAPTGSMLLARCGATATRLSDGDVLIAGGWTPSGVTAEAELYHSASGTFSRVGRMHTPRANQTATLLLDGRVLLAGGEVGDLVATEKAEVFDPRIRTFTIVGSLREPRAAQAATLLTDGRVLVAGGQNDSTALASAELFDPQKNAFTAAGKMQFARTKLAAVRLADGKVLVMGGQTDGLRGRREASAELYDPETDSFSETGSMHEARFKITNAAVLLPNGNVLVAGGSERAEVYSESAGAFSFVAGSLGIARHYGSATALAKGDVLIAGGYTMPDPKVVGTAVLYTARP